DPNDTDEYGYSALHVLAWWGRQDWEKKISEKKKCEDEIAVDNPLNVAGIGGPWMMLRDKKADVSLTTHLGLTPLDVALYRKKSSMVASLILELYAERRWIFKNSTAFTFDISRLNLKNDLKPLDYREMLYNDVEHKEPYNTVESRQSGVRYGNPDIIYNPLEIVVRGNDAETLLQVPLFQVLLEAKWVLYAKHMFNWYFFWSVTYLFFFAFAVALLPLPDPNNSSVDRRDYKWNDNFEKFRFSFELILVIANILSVFRTLHDIIDLIYVF
ncbi:hypothetical protein HK096_007052, partial [Nowakowskiella sp. JEL0078]